jgi:hypothetical protein
MSHLRCPPLQTCCVGCGEFWGTTTESYLLQITMPWHYYTYELCSVRSLRAVLIMNSKTVFSTVSLARFEVITVVLLKIEVFLDVMMCHWVSSSQQLRWPYCLQKSQETTWPTTQNYIPQDINLQSSVLSSLGWQRNASMEGSVSTCFPDNFLSCFCILVSLQLYM